MARRRRKTPSLIPAWALVIIHIAVLGCALLIYALFHHVIPHQEQAVGIRSSRVALSTPVPTAAPEPTATPEPQELAINIATAKPTATPNPTPTPAPTDEPGSFRIKFANKFIKGNPQASDNYYVSENVNLTVSTTTFADTACHVADIYIADIGHLVTAFGEDKFGRSYAEHPRTFAKRFKALVTLSGDYYGARSDGVVIRNGMLYRDKASSRDVCVLYWDGSMKTFSPRNFDAETEMKNGAYQAWNFGPALLDSQGNAKKDFNTDVFKANPRAAIGYFEPGHYCFVMVEGRNEQTEGLTMAQLSKFMYNLGCTQAYNLDGGQSATMVKLEDTYGNPVNGGRELSDVIMVLDYILETEGAQ